MTNIPNTNLSKKEVRNILTSAYYNYGGESIICRTDNPHTLYKIFRNGKKVGRMSENKFQKIKRLHELSLEHSTIPVGTLSQKGELIGYEMTFDKNDTRFCPSSFPKDIRIRFLEETKDILEYFASKNIVYGDIAYRNILYNPTTGEFKFCDMDNIQLEDYPIDLISRTGSLATYVNECGITTKTDAYMHNGMTLSTLGIEYPFFCEEDIEDCFASPAENIIDSMITPHSFTGEYLVKYLRKDR